MFFLYLHELLLVLLLPSTVQKYACEVICKVQIVCRCVRMSELLCIFKWSVMNWNLFQDVARRYPLQLG